mmetsp:Transcript_34626/g.87615  ORF Transcript_34626/g.87615 Transcript_34626/m.87615 type:complete len:275 (-) Transcript_34626:758-1582(-)
MFSLTVFQDHQIQDMPSLRVSPAPTLPVPTVTPHQSQTPPSCPDPCSSHTLSSHLPATAATAVAVASSPQLLDSAACAARRARSTASRLRRERYWRTAVKLSVVHVTVACDDKVWLQPGLLHHGRRVAAHQHRLVRDEPVVVIQRIRVLVAWQRALVHCHLAVVLAQGLQAARDLEQPVRDGEELGLAHSARQLGVVDGDGLRLQGPGVREPHLARQAQEVVDVQRAAQALAQQYGVCAQLLGQPPVAVHVAEVHLAPRRQHAVRLPQYGGLVR